MIRQLADLKARAGDGLPARRILSELTYLTEIFAAQAQDVPADVLDAIAALQTHITDEGALTYSAVYACEQRLAQYAELAKSYTLLCAAHAHIDMNWMWGTDETTGIVIDTFQTMLNLMEEYPQFCFSQSQAATYAIIEEYCPELLPQIRARVAEGRWEVTAATWVEEDQNMSSTESIARHLLYSRQYLSALLDIDPAMLDLDFEPDTFGHSAHMPMLLQQGGVRYLYYCRGYDCKRAFRWRAPSGDEVLALCEPGWYHGAIEYDMTRFLPQWCAENGLRTALKVYGVGDHGGGPTRRDIERIQEMATWPLGPQIRFGTMREFFQELERVRAQLPVVEKELNFIFPGCYTSQSRLKQANRHGEDHLYDAEALSAMAILAGGRCQNPQGFTKAWKKILFNQFHDILPGSCTRESREFALGAAQEAGSYAIGNANRAMRALGQMTDTLRFGGAPDASSPAEGGGVGFGTVKSSRMEREYDGTGFHFTAVQRGSGTVRAYTIFNTTAYARSETVELTVWDWSLDLDDTVICDGAGQEVAFTALQPRREYWRHQFDKLAFRVDVPPFGFANYYVLQAKQPRTRYIDPEPRELPRADVGYVLENDVLRAVLAPAGCKLVSLYDKAAQRELLSGGATFRLVEEEESFMSSWIVGDYARVCDLQQAQAVTVVEAHCTGEVQWVTYELKFGRSLLRLRVSLSGQSRVLRLSADCDFQELGGNGLVPQLQLYIPYSFAPRAIRCDVPGGVIDRPELAHDIPVIRYCAPVPQDGGSTLLLTTDCKYGVRAWENALTLDLLRASTVPDRYPEQGVHQFEIGLGAAASADSDVLRTMADCFAHPLYAYSNSLHTGTLGQSGSFLNVSGAAVTALKPAESGHGVALRLLNERADAVECRIDSDYVQKQQIVTMLETPCAQNAPVLAPQSITTLTLQ